MKVTMFKPVSKPAFHPVRNEIFMIFINHLCIDIAQLEKSKDQVAALNSIREKRNGNKPQIPPLSWIKGEAETFGEKQLFQSS